MFMSQPDDFPVVEAPTLVLRLKQHFPSELTDAFKHTRKGEQRLNAATVKTILIILQ